MIFLQPSIDPVIFSFSFIEIRWYSLAYVFSFLIGAHLIKILNHKSINKIKNKEIDDFFIWAIIGVIFGGRIGYVLFYQTITFINNPIYILYIWKGGMSFHGGLFGMMLSIYCYSKLRSFDFFLLADLISIVAPIGLFLGRIANFINVELYGRVTNFPLAVIYPTVDDLPRHPSQLYEAFFEGIFLFIILIYLNNKKIVKIKTGLISSFFLLFYSIFRFFIEFIREPDLHLGLYLNLFTMGQILCLPLFILSILIFLKKIN